MRKPRPFPPLPPQRNLRNLFRYDRDTGALTRTVSVGPRAIEGNPAGYVRHGIMFVMVDGQEYHAARVVWKFVTGEEPGEVVHMDANRCNLRFANLAHPSATYARTPGSTIPRVGRLSRRNTSGVTGVSFNTKLGRWHAKITVDKKQIHLGIFATKDEAINARLAAERRYGFKPSQPPVTPTPAAPTPHAGRSTQPDPDAAAFGAS